MARPIVLIHGSPGAPASWKGVAKALGGAAEIIAPSLPDHGGSTPPQRRETHEMAAQIAAALGPQPAGIVLAGHSFGGNVALQIALSGAMKVAALVLVEPVTLAVLPALGEDAAFAEARALFDSYLERGHAGDPAAIGIMIDFWFGAASFARMPEPVREFLGSQMAVNLRDVEATFRERHAREELAALAMPLTVAWGSNSPPVARLIAERLAATAPQGRAVRLEGADHGMLASHAPQVAALIVQTASRAAG